MRITVVGSGVWTSYNSIATNSYTLSNLTYNTSYEWQVMGVNTCNSSDWSDLKTFTSELAAPTNLAPTGAAIVLNPTLTWSAVAGAESYTVRFSTDPTLTTYVTYTTSTNSQVLTGLLSLTNYYFKVDASNTAGNLSDWSTTASFQTTVTLTAPILSAPANSATSQAMGVSYSWGSVLNATSYEIQVSATETPFSPIIDQTVTTASYSGTLPYFQTQYFWRVKALRGTIQSDWSTVWHFSTLQIPAPTLATPANAATVDNLTPTLTWNAVTGGSNVYYMVEILQGQDEVLTIDAITGTSLTVPSDNLTWATTYTWQVKAYQTGHSENWSTTRTFVTPDVPAVTLISPIDGQSILHGTAISFSWSTVSPISGYEFEISTNSTFASPIVDQTPTTAAYTQAGTLAGSSTGIIYYWRARAVNGASYGAWATYRTFYVTESAPLTVSITNNFATTFCNSTDSVYFGSPALVVSITNGSGNYSYAWTSSDGSITGFNNPDILNPTLSRSPISGYFAAQHFTLTVTDNTSNQIASADVYMNLPSSPTVVMVSPSLVRKLRSAPAIDLNTRISTINGVTYTESMTGFTLNWKSSNDPSWPTSGVTYPSTTPNANPTVNGLIRYELTVFANGNGCQSTVHPTYIFSYGGLGREGEYSIADAANSSLVVCPSIVANNEKLNVQAVAIEKGDLQIKIVNLVGQEVMSFNFPNTDQIDQQINVSGLSSGVYFLLMNGAGEQLSTKFVKE
jgi:hypothetical protein